MLRERVEPDGMARDEFGVMQPLGDDDVQQRQRERRVGARTNAGTPRRTARRLRSRRTSIVTTCAPRRLAATRWRAVLGWLARFAPQSRMSAAVLAHVLLRVGLEDAGETEAEGAEPPADHRRAPPLTAVEIREAAHEMRSDPRAVVVGEESVPRPGADGLSARRAHAGGDPVQRLIPRRAPEFVPAPRRGSADAAGGAGCR